MNSNTPFEVFPENEREELTQLAELAQTLQPDERFLKKTEGLLKEAAAVEKENRMKRLSFFWQTLAGTTAIVALAVLIIWLVKGVAPATRVTPVPALPATGQAATPTAEATPLPTATPALPAYERFGTTIYRAVDFPAAPMAAAEVYAYSPSEQSATVESVQALAQRLGLNGRVYEGGYYAYRYLVSDGQQRLFVNSDQDFLYFYDAVSLPTLPDLALEAATPLIEAYLEGHGFTFAHKIQAGSAPGWFTVLPVTAEGLPTFFGSGSQGLSLAMSPTGQVLQLQATLYANAGPSQGQFPLLSAEEAWQKFIDPATWLGVTENEGTGIDPNSRSWQRTYPENQPLTLYCRVTTYPALAAGQPPLITCDDFTLSGKTAGLEDSQAPNLSFVALQGQFVTEAGLCTFQVESWAASSLQKQYLSGGEVRREGDQVLYTVAGTAYQLRDVPEDFPIPATDVGLSGVAVDQVLEWETLGLHLFWGGGGGGGRALAKLNLSGTPVPWPTPEPVVSPTPSTFLGQRLEGVRGDLRILIYQKTDGSQETEYNFSPKNDANYTTYLLQGPDLTQLDHNHNRPVDIWGSVTGYTPTGVPILTVERSVIPYPDLKFEVLRGKQKVSSLNGETVTLLTTTTGKVYAQVSGEAPDASLIAAEDDLVDVIVLAIPDETWGGYPTVHVFGGGPASETGTELKLEDLAAGPDKPFVIHGDSTSTGALPVLTIDSLDLVYYVADPRSPTTAGAYLQPVWRFAGHYDNGNVFECLVQALRPEYLYPEEEPTGN